MYPQNGGLETAEGRLEGRLQVGAGRSFRGRLPSHLLPPQHLFIFLLPGHFLCSSFFQWGCLIWYTALLHPATLPSNWLHFIRPYIYLTVSTVITLQYFSGLNPSFLSTKFELQHSYSWQCCVQQLRLMDFPDLIQGQLWDTLCSYETQKKSYETPKKTQKKVMRHTVCDTVHNWQAPHTWQYSVWPTNLRSLNLRL